MQRPQSSIILLMIIMAIVMGVGGFLALTYVQSRPEAPEGGEAAAGGTTVIVEGVEVQLNPDPSQAVRLSGDTAPPAPADNTTAVDPNTAVVETLPTSTPTPPVIPTNTPIPALPTRDPNPIIFETYTVQNGDSLYSIANRMDTSITLMARYGISSEQMVPGTQIQIPIGNPPYCPGTRVYAVGEKDTTYNVSRTYNTTPERLKELNNLDDNYTIYSASIICVP